KRSIATVQVAEVDGAGPGTSDVIGSAIGSIWHLRTDRIAGAEEQFYGELRGAGGGGVVVGIGARAEEVERRLRVIHELVQIVLLDVGEKAGLRREYIGEGVAEVIRGVAGLSAAGRRESAFCGVEVVQGQANLLEVIGALRAVG